MLQAKEETQWTGIFSRKTDEQYLQCRSNTSVLMPCFEKWRIEWKHPRTNKDVIVIVAAVVVVVVVFVVVRDIVVVYLFNQSPFRCRERDFVRNEDVFFTGAMKLFEFEFKDKIKISILARFWLASRSANGNRRQEYFFVYVKGDQHSSFSSNITSSINDE